jgi:hypothetical protein
VRGVSEGASCIGSNSDCLDIDEVSVLLPPSPKWCICPGDSAGGDDIPSPAFPVISSLEKASTSSEARTGPAAFDVGAVGPSLCVRSIVSKVFENGLGGAL